ncbi:MAG: amidohydrolase family protein, partial [Gemmatimonadaceae bacterium]
SGGSVRTTVVVFMLGWAASAAAQARMQLGPDTREFVKVDAPVVALTHVRLLDGTGSPAKDNYAVIIRGDRIEQVGPAASLTIPSGATVLELGGRTVIPGIIGLHEHTYFRSTTRTTQMSYSAPRIWLGYGVTTIRTAGSMFPYNELNLQRAIEAGTVPGPRMHITGPYLNGTAGAEGLNRAVRSNEEARRVVAYWGEEGATWLKFQGSVTREVLGAAIDEAHKRGMKVTGHLCSVTFREAAALGIDNLEHGFITNSDYIPDKRPDACPASNMRHQVNVDVRGPEVQATFRDLLVKKVAITSTLSVYELFVRERAKLDPRAMALLAADTKREVEAEFAALGNGSAFAVPLALFEKMLAFDLMFHRAGGVVGAGVDPWGNGSLPGVGNLRNYEILVEAGFRPEEAVQVLTANGAKILGEYDQVGSIEPGKFADLVVIRGDPVRRPGDVYEVELTFKRGVGYDAPKLVRAAAGQVGLR